MPLTILAPGQTDAFTQEAEWEDPLELADEIERLKEEKDAVILAHYYVDGEIQDIADFAGDSLQLARDAASVEKSTIVFQRRALHGGVGQDSQS